MHCYFVDSYHFIAVSSFLYSNVTCILVLQVRQLEDTIVNTTGCRATGTASVHTKDKRGEKLLFTEKPEENAGTPASASFKDVRSSCFPEIFRVSDKAEVVEFGGQKESNNDISSDRSQDHSAVIMEKIFGGALTLDGSSTDELVLKVSYLCHNLFLFSLFS